MMLKELQKCVNLNWIKKNNVWDVVVYGSYVRGKYNPNDIDIAIILNEPSSAKNKLLLSQELRKMLPGKKYAFDVKTVDLNDLLNNGFLGREAILAEGLSILKKVSLAERFGFTAFALIEYSLKKLTKAKQKMFYYALSGRKRGTGFLSKHGGKIISKGVLKVPTKHLEEMKSLMEINNVSYKITFSLEYRTLHQ